MTTSPSRTMLEQLVDHVFRAGAIVKEAPGTAIVYAPVVHPDFPDSDFKHMAPIITIHHENAEVAALAAVRAIGVARGRLDASDSPNAYRQAGETLNTVADGILRIVALYEAGASRAEVMGVAHDIVGYLHAVASRAEWIGQAVPDQHITGVPSPSEELKARLADALWAKEQAEAKLAEAERKIRGVREEASGWEGSGYGGHYHSKTEAAEYALAQDILAIVGQDPAHEGAEGEGER